MASNSVVGFLSCLVSSVFFGSMFVPVKPFDAHDGFFVQWVMGCAIFIVGLVVNAFKHFPQFYPLSMLGGFLWATGNVTAIPIVNTIGMGLGILLWSFTNLLAGWASGRYGWFGLKPQVPKSDKLNYFGMLFALISTIMFVLVKPAEQHHSADEETATIDNINYEPDGVLASTEYPEVSSVNVNSGERRSILDRAATALKADPRRTLAILASLAAGTLYGLNFTPVIYIQDNYAGAPQDGLSYVFAHFCGCFAGNTFYFLIYCAYKQNRPKINPRVAAPAFVMGLLWSIAQASWFVANKDLSEAISFPIISRFPGVVAALWGVLYFKEIRGRRNLHILLWAIIITLIGGILSGLSKEIEW